MLGLGPAKVLLGGAIVALLPGALGSVAIAATAKQPTLSIRVKPSTVHPSQQYKITITGSYDKTAVHTKSYLIAVIQYTAGPCKSTAKAEAALPKRNWIWDFWPKVGLSVPPSFTRYDTWTAQHRLGTRHVCAYLYPQPVSATSDVKPLVSASATFRNV